MYVVVGLGNPGKQYEKTRHNVGFMVVDELANRHQAKFKKGAASYYNTKIFIGRKPVHLLKPTTFMNLSGDAVRHFIDYHKLEDFSKILVVLDDINLSFGTVRLRAEGSAGGQKGLKSIIDKLNTTKIPRLRVGIGSNFYDATSHVLSPFSKTEKKELPQIINWAADAAESFVKYRIERTMNRFNRNIFNVNNKEELS